MATTSDRDFGQILNTWVQTIGIIIAAAWAAYTFTYKEIISPKSAPVNISMALELKKIPVNESQSTSARKPLVAVEMQVSATNPSLREVYLLASAWIAYGYTIEKSERDEKVFETEGVSKINALEGEYVERHAKISRPAIVAMGSLFQDNLLKPSEKTTRTLVFYLPGGVYDRIDVFASMPTMERKNGAFLEWKFEKGSRLYPIVYRQSKNGERKEMEKRKDGSYADSSLELQSTTAMSVLSL